MSSYKSGPRRSPGDPELSDSPEPAGQLRGAAAEPGRRAEPRGRLEQVTARAAGPRWELPGGWGGPRRRAHLTQAAATPPTGRGRAPLAFLRGPGRSPRCAPNAQHPRSSRGSRAATLSAPGMRWKAARLFPAESPKRRSGPAAGSRPPGPASEGAARWPSCSLPGARRGRAERARGAKVSLKGPGPVRDLAPSTGPMQSLSRSEPRGG